MYSTSFTTLGCTSLGDTGHWFVMQNILNLHSGVDQGTKLCVARNCDVEDGIVEVLLTSTLLATSYGR